MCLAHAGTTIAAAAAAAAAAATTNCKGAFKMGNRQGPACLGSPLTVHCTTGSEEEKRPFHVNGFSDVVKHNGVLYKMKILIVQTRLKA